MLFEPFPKAVETHTPKDLSTVSTRVRMLRELFLRTSMEALKKIPLPEHDSKLMNKALLVEALSRELAFPSITAFDAWITLFPPLSQEMLRDAALYGCGVLSNYAGKSDKPLLPKQKYYSSWDLKLEPWLGLDFLLIAENLDQLVFCLPTAFRDAIKFWFVPPPEGVFSNCVVDSSAGIAYSSAGVAYSNALEVAGSFPLLCEAVLPALAEFLGFEGTRIPDNEYINLRPFIKKQLAALRVQCGFKPFPAVYDKPPDSLDLAARFILAMTRCKPKRPEDGQDGVKALVEDFFAAGGKSKKEPDNYESYKWDYIEIHILTAHLKKRSLGWGHFQGPPPSRRIFQKILTMIAKNGGWFNALSLARYILLNEDLFHFVQLNGEDRLLYKVSSINIDGVTYKNEYGETEIWPFASFRFELLVRPLFYAYCYLFAALGLLEITQKTPPEPAVSRGRPKPVSPYDALDAVRITDLGRWCLGLTGERPNRLEEKYEAIADKELLLVTVRGSSFERSLYLDSIGEKLGEDRWRISKRSFIAGCENRADIEGRISKFRRLIDNKPAPHWEALFSKTSEWADVLKGNLISATVYYLGNHRDLAEDLLNDPALASCAMRAEGGMLVVPLAYQKKFSDLLADHGVICTY